MPVNEATRAAELYRQALTDQVCTDCKIKLKQDRPCSDITEAEVVPSQVLSTPYHAGAGREEHREKDSQIQQAEGPGTQPEVTHHRSHASTGFSPFSPNVTIAKFHQGMSTDNFQDPCHKCSPAQVCCKAWRLRLTLTWRAGGGCAGIGGAPDRAAAEPGARARPRAAGGAAPAAGGLLCILGHLRGRQPHARSRCSSPPPSAEGPDASSVLRHSCNHRCR